MLVASLSLLLGVLSAPPAFAGDVYSDDARAAVWTSAPVYKTATYTSAVFAYESYCPNYEASSYYYNCGVGGEYGRPNFFSDSNCAYPNGGGAQATITNFVSSYASGRARFSWTATCDYPGMYLTGFLVRGRWNWSPAGSTNDVNFMDEFTLSWSQGPVGSLQPPPPWKGIGSPYFIAGGGSPDQNSSHCQCADPVNTATGEFWETKTDLSLPGRLPVTASRTYSSLRANTSGLFGFGWSSPWDMRVVAGSPTRVIHENGAETQFTPSGNAFTADPDIFATLARDTTTGAYTYQRRNANSFTFDTNGRLSSIKDRNGETTSLTWTAAVLTIKTSDARTLTGSLDASGRIVQLAGPGGRTIGYHYDATGDLDAVTDPDGKVWRYSYASHLMQSNSDPLGNTTTTAYDTSNRVTSQTNQRGGVTTFAYQGDLSGGRTRVADPAGVVTHYYYRSGLLWSRIINPDAGYPVSAVWKYAYDNYGSLIQTTDSAGALTTATYDSRGNVLTSTDAAGLTTTWTYNSFNEPLTRTDNAAHQTTWTYDTKGNLLTTAQQLSSTVTATTTLTRSSTHPADVLTSKDPDGRTTTLTYSNEGFVSSTTAPDTGKRTTTGNPYGQPLTTVSEKGNVTGGTPATYTTSRAYDPRGNLTTVTAPAGRGSTFTYDDASRQITARDARGKTTTTTYGPDGAVASVTDPLNRTTSTSYDIAGRPVGITAPDGGSVTQTYDSNGLVSTKTDPLGNAPGATAADKAAHTTTFTYNAAGMLLTTQTPDPASAGVSLTASVAYDAGERVASTTNPNGEAVTFTYNNVGRLASMKSPSGESTTYGYDWAGNRTTITDGLSHTTTTSYLASGRVQSVTDGAGNVTKYTYDTTGRLASVIDPRGNCSGCSAGNYTSTTSYDVNGNVTRTTDNLGHGTTFSYDAADRLTGKTDPKSHTSSYAYDIADRLSSVAAPDGGITGFGYDDANQRTSVTTPTLKIWTYGFDAAGRPSQTTDPLGQVSRRLYGLDGRQTSLVTARESGSGNGTVAYGYDALGRLTTINPGSGGSVVTFAYDKASRINSMTDGAGTQTRTYDASGRLTRVTRNGASWNYSYYADGTIWTRDRPDGSRETWAYDAGGRPATLDNPQGRTTFKVDPSGRLLSTTFPSATSETETWDRDGYLASVTTKSGKTTLTSQTVTRDVTDNPTQIVVARGSRATETRSYVYDVNERLQGVCYVAITSCTGSAAATQYWTYDRDGNRLTEKDGLAVGTTINYTYDAASRIATRQVGTGAATNYGFDADGNLLSDGNSTWTYDLFGRVTSTTTGGAVASRALDGLGRLLSQTSTGGTTSYDWDVTDSNPTPATITNAGSITSYRYDPAGRAMMITSGGATSTLAHDALGSITDVISSAGAVTRSQDYTPFGDTRPAVGAPTPSGAAPQLGFSGMLDAGPSGTLTTRDRSFQPSMGVWNQPDPLPSGIADPFSSPYSYVEGRPTRLTDPLGDKHCWNPFTTDPHCALLDKVADFLTHDTGNVGGNLARNTVRALVNVGRGATFGATDTVADTVSPGASCTVDGTSFQARLAQISGGIASTILTGGSGDASVALRSSGAVRRDAELAGSAEDGAAAARGLSSHGGVLASEANEAGGTVVTSTGAISQNDVAPLVNSGMYGGNVNVISGVHGLADGSHIVDASMYADDVARFGNLPGVSIFNLPDLSAAEITGLLRGPGTTVGAFCDSGACLAPFR